MANIEIPITQNGTTSLKTAGKYCDRDIDVHVAVTGGDTDAAYQQGFVEGKQTEQDQFWDTFQQNGNRDDYTYGFARWDRTIFAPKYDIRGTFNSTFHNFNRNDADWETLDMVEYLQGRNIVMDTSRSTTLVSTFMWACIGRIGVIDCTGTTNNTLTTTFGYGKIKTIDKLIVKPENLFTNTFINNTELTNITFEGTIANNISFQWQGKLSRASIESVINALSTTTSGNTVTFNKGAVTNAFGSTTATEWTTLVGTKTNWTISLV